MNQMMTDQILDKAYEEQQSSLGKTASELGSGVAEAGGEISLELAIDGAVDIVGGAVEVVGGAAADLIGGIFDGI